MYWKNTNDSNNSNNRGAAHGTNPYANPRVTPERRRAAAYKAIDGEPKVDPERFQEAARGVLETYQDLSLRGVNRSVILPVVAFDALQDLKRKYGIYSNAEAVSYALATADSLEAFLEVYDRVYQEAYQEALRGGGHG